MNGYFTGIAVNSMLVSHEEWFLTKQELFILVAINLYYARLPLHLRSNISGCFDESSCIAKYHPTLHLSTVLAFQFEYKRTKDLLIIKSNKARA